MSKVTLTRLSSLVNATSAINGILTQIESAFDNTLSRNGAAPNTMAASLDMNSNRIINLPDPGSTAEPVTLGYLTTHFAGGGGGGGGGGGTTTSPAGDTANTVAAFQLTTFDALIKSARILGYSTVGVGPFTVKRVNAEPTHLWKFRSLDRVKADGTTDATNGGWWEGVPDGNKIYYESFGAVGDNTTDCSPAWTMAHSYCVAKVPPGISYTSLELHCGPGVFRHSQTCAITQAMCVYGAAGGMGGTSSSTRFNFDYGRHGFTLFPSSSAGSVISHLNITCNNAVNTAPWDIRDMYFGIVAVYRCIVENCFFSNWHGGLFITSNYDVYAGNVDNWVVRDCSFFYNAYYGCRIYGYNGNQGQMYGCTFLGNAGVGLIEDSMLGNQYFGVHTEGNAFPTSASVAWNLTPYVIHGTNYYVIQHQDPLQTSEPVPNLTNAQTHVPGTDATWYLLGAAATFFASEATTPLWGRVLYNGVVYDVVPGQEANMWTSQPDTHPAVWASAGAPTPGHQYITWLLNHKPYIYGGGFANRSTLGRSVFDGCYLEDGQMAYDIGTGYWVQPVASLNFTSNSQVASISTRPGLSASRSGLYLTGAVFSNWLTAANKVQSVAYNYNENVLGWQTTDDGSANELWALSRDHINHNWSFNVTGTTVLAFTTAQNPTYGAGAVYIPKLVHASVYGSIATTGGNYTVADGDEDIIFSNAGASSTITLPSATPGGRTLWLKTVQNQAVVSASANVVPINGGAAGTAILAATAGKWAKLKSDGSNWVVMAAN